MSSIKFKIFDPDIIKKGILYNGPVSFGYKRTNFITPDKFEIESKKPSINGDWINFESNDGYSSLKKGDSVKLNNNTIIITDQYGVRDFGGRKGQHSNGIDFKTNNGKAVAVKDGQIVDVKLQGNGETIKPTEGAAAGYYVVVKHNDGSYGQYMHLDPMSDEQMQGLKGKSLKRGDEIWGYSKGSGSSTGPHVKFRLYGESPKVNIDPSQAIRGEDYLFIPDANGNNILKND